MITKTYSELATTGLVFEGDVPETLQDYRTMAKDSGLEYIGPTATSVIAMSRVTGMFMGLDNYGFISELWCSDNDNPRRPSAIYYLTFQEGNAENLS